MQTKLKPIFLLVILAATAMLLYAANDVRAQNPSIGIFDVSAFRPDMISINPKLGPPGNVVPMDSALQYQRLERQYETHPND